MKDAYPVDSGRLDSLRATRAGRIALDGFEYQRAFAVLRLASLALRRAVPGALEIPNWIRYEWGEDIDELATDGSVVLWQCKRGEGWGQPGKVVEVLEGFAPKWLWTPDDERHRLRFRLVTSDPAFAAAHDLPRPLDAALKDKTEASFQRLLGEVPGERSDRARWQADAEAAGVAVLFAGLWGQTAVLYVSGRASDHAGVAIRHAEDQAVHELAKGRRVRDASQISRVVADLQSLLTTRPPGEEDGDGLVSVPDVPPEVIQPCDVDARLFLHGPTEPEPAPFRVVDRTFLQKSRNGPVPAPFIGRLPEWADVVRGRDERTRFFERSGTEAVERSLREALDRAALGAGRLQVQFLTGAPGAGKSTLALRAAAKLVDAGTCIVAEARYRRAAGEDVRGFVDAVYRLATGGRPVLLLLDDPLGADSGWPQLLTLLSRGVPRVVVLAATPDFLFERHKGKLDGVQILPAIAVERPLVDERLDLARLHPEADSRVLAVMDEDLIVVSMMVAPTEPFDAILSGIWLTLADQRVLSPDALGEELPWPVVAFLTVAFFQRAEVACPEMLLVAVLAGRADAGEAAAERLETLKLANGWRIFRLPASEGQAQEGASVLAMHPRVADRAWRCRPLPAWSIGSAVARSSTFVPQIAPTIGLVAAALCARRLADAESFLQTLAVAWSAGEVRDRIGTLHFVELNDSLHLRGIRAPPALKAELARRAAVADAWSWLAALQLFRESSAASGRRSFPPRLAVGPLVQAADFSVSPDLVPQFANAISGRPDDLACMEARLWAAFDDGPVDPALLAWLVEWSTPAEVINRLPALRRWLGCEEDDALVRAAFVHWIMTFPTEAAAGDVPAVLDWVRRHPHDRRVRTQLLKLLAVAHSPDLAVVLAETIDAIDLGDGAPELASIALAASADLGADRSGLIGRWLVWAGDALASNEGNRNMEAIAGALPAPYRTLSYFSRTKQVPAPDQATATVALQSIPEVCQRWYRSVDLPCPTGFG